MAEKVEWMNKIRSLMQPSKGAPSRGASPSESGLPIRQSLSDGSLVSSKLMVNVHDFNYLSLNEIEIKL